MRRKPRQERSKKRVERILDAAAALIEREGVAAVSTNAIAREAEVPIGTLYQFFPNKQEVLAELLVRQLEALDAAFEPFVARAMAEEDLDPLVAAAIDTLADAYQRIPALAPLVTHMRTDPAGGAVLRENNTRIELLLQGVLDRRLPGREAAAVARMLVEATDGVLQHWLADLPPSDRSTLNALKAMISAYLRALG